MTINVRAATADDAETISELNDHVQSIHAQALPWLFKKPSAETFPPHEVKKIVANSNQLVFVAETNDLRVGYIHASMIRRPETSLQYAVSSICIHQVCVLPEYRGRGVGQALVQGIRSEGEKLGAKFAELDVWNFNEEARGFFEVSGFQPFNQRLWDL